MKHELKIMPEYFEAILSGDKTFEVRSVKDRIFHPGDDLRLREFDSAKHIVDGAGYSGREVTVQVTYVMPGITFKGDEAVVMSIFLLKERDEIAIKAIGDFRDDLIKR